jgi:hypothetical protein
LNVKLKNVFLPQSLACISLIPFLLPRMPIQGFD